MKSYELDMVEWIKSFNFDSQVREEILTMVSKISQSDATISHEETICKLEKVIAEYLFLRNEEEQEESAGQGVKHLVKLKKAAMKLSQYIKNMNSSSLRILRAYEWKNEWPSGMLDETIKDLKHSLDRLEVIFERTPDWEDYEVSRGKPGRPSCRFLIWTLADIWEEVTGRNITGSVVNSPYPAKPYSKTKPSKFGEFIQLVAGPYLDIGLDGINNYIRKLKQSRK